MSRPYLKKGSRKEPSALHRMAKHRTNKPISDDASLPDLFASRVDNIAGFEGYKQKPWARGRDQEYPFPIPSTSEMLSTYTKLSESNATTQADQFQGKSLLEIAFSDLASDSNGAEAPAVNIYGALNQQYATVESQFDQQLTNDDILNEFTQLERQLESMSGDASVLITKQVFSFPQPGKAYPSNLDSSNGETQLAPSTEALNVSRNDSVVTSSQSGNIGQVNHGIQHLPSASKASDDTNENPKSTREKTTLIQSSNVTPHGIYTRPKLQDVLNPPQNPLPSTSKLQYNEPEMTEVVNKPSVRLYRSAHKTANNNADHSKSQISSQIQLMMEKEQFLKEKLIVEQAKQLELELETYKKENSELKKMKKLQENAVKDIMNQKSEVAKWAQQVRDRTELWCQEQKQSILQEKREAAKSILDSKRRASAAVSHLPENQSTEANIVKTGEKVLLSRAEQSVPSTRDAAYQTSFRKDKQQMEALIATIQKLNLDLEVQSKRAKMNEKRLQQVISDHVAKINQLETSLQSMEREHLLLWTFVDDMGINLPINFVRMRPKALIDRDNETKKTKQRHNRSHVEKVNVEYVPIVTKVTSSVEPLRGTRIGSNVRDGESRGDSVNIGDYHKGDDDGNDDEDMRDEAWQTRTGGLPHSSVARGVTDNYPRPEVRALSRSQSHGGCITNQSDRRVPDAEPHVTRYNNGTTKEVFSDGHYVVRFANGDTKTVHPSAGQVVYYYAQAQTVHTTYLDGLEEYVFPNNQVERHYSDGRKEIIFPTGAKKVILPE